MKVDLALLILALSFVGRVSKGAGRADKKINAYFGAFAK